MPKQTFIFKQFTVRQDKCAMKVGTDAVLLGAWVDPENSKRILDIGTGTGIIAIMLAQKTQSSIDAIDLDENACIQANENVDNCPWKERIRVIHTSAQDFGRAAGCCYDLVVSNPPYFLHSTKSPEKERTLARHTDLLAYEELLESVLRLLEKKGKFCIILPFKEGEYFRGIAEKKKLFLTKMVRIRTRADKIVDKRLMMQFEFERKSFSETCLLIEKDERHNYSEEYKRLTKDYYLAF